MPDLTIKNILTAMENGQYHIEYSYEYDGYFTINPTHPKGWGGVEEVTHDSWTAASLIIDDEEICRHTSRDGLEVAPEFHKHRHEILEALEDNEITRQPREEHEVFYDLRIDALAEALTEAVESGALLLRDDEREFPHQYSLIISLEGERVAGSYEVTATGEYARIGLYGDEDAAQEFIRRHVI